MAAENEHRVPECVMRALREAGYRPDETMRAHALAWWGWYTAKAPWYDRTEEVGGRRFRVRRQTLHPARSGIGWRA